MKYLVFAGLALMLSLCGRHAARAQTFFSGYEWGVSAGGSQYFGDLNEQYGFRYVRPAAGVFGRYHFNPYISMRASVTATRVGYEDRFSSNPFNRKRNLGFRSDVLEGALIAEFNFFRFATGEPQSRFTPYLAGGIGAFYYNPYTTYAGRRYYLRPLGTEGQQAGYDERKYSTVSVCFPIGAGVKYWMRPGLNVGFEIANRLTLTDYLDDVSATYVGSDKFPTDPGNPNPAYYLQDRSIGDGDAPLGRAGKQRGNATSKDQYLLFMFTMSIQLKTYRCPDYLSKGY